MIDPLRNGSLFDPAAHALHRTIANSSQPGVAERRRVLHDVAGRLKELDARLETFRGQGEGAQAYLRFLVPADLLVREFGLATAAATAAPAEGEELDPRAADLMHDVRMYMQLENLRDSLGRLQANNKRFGVVVDLMLAATHLLEPATHTMADGFLTLHIQQCELQISQVQSCLSDFPRVRAHIGSSKSVS